MHRLLLLGLNHTTAPLAVREKLAMSAERHRELIVAFKERFAEAEAVLLSTCNRVELYAARATRGHPRTAEMLAFLAEFQNVPAAEFSAHVYEKAERAAIEHLFAVASSLDSMVLGETQILGQVRAAYDVSAKLSAAGAVLNPLFQRAIAVGKAVMNGTSLAEGRLSVASVAVDHAKQIFETFTDKTLLCVGAGKMATAVMQHFAALKPARLLICNRDPAKAEALAARFGGTAVPFDRLHDHLVAADIVISSTGSAMPIITRQQFDSLRRPRRGRPIVLIDIAVPRDIEAAVGELDNVYLYNVDDLQQVVAGTLASRKDAIDAARAIVTRSVDEFLVWHRTRELGPVIDQLYKRSHELAREELDRTIGKLPNVSAEERQHLEELTRRIVNKLLHDPIKTLRETNPAHGPGGQYVHAMQKLFHLADEPQDAGEADAAESIEAAAKALGKIATNSAGQSAVPPARPPFANEDELPASGGNSSAGEEPR
jgi:glutamyl-tRNA reductase